MARPALLRTPRPPKRGAPGSRAGSGRRGPRTCCRGCPLASSQTFWLIKVLVKYATERLVSTDAFKCPRSRPRPRWIGSILGNLPYVDVDDHPEAQAPPEVAHSCSFISPPGAVNRSCSPSALATGEVHEAADRQQHVQDDHDHHQEPHDGGEWPSQGVMAGLAVEPRQGVEQHDKDCGHHHSAEGYQGVTGKEHKHLLGEEELEGAAQWE